MLSLADRIELVQLYYANGKSSTATLRKFKTVHKLSRDPFSITAIANLISKFETTGSVLDLPKSGRKPVSNPVIEEVRLANEQGLATSSSGCYSAHQIAKATGHPYATVRKILKTKLHNHPYHLKCLHELRPLDYEARVNFANWFLNNCEGSSLWERTLWTDEAHFYLDGFVCTKHCVIWARENPHCYRTKPLHQRKVTVWCGFTNSRILPPAFVPEGQTVNTDVYLDILRNHMLPNLPRNHGLVFMQDGAPAHTSNATKEFLKETFGEQNIISRGCPINWPSRSPDLNPCDFFLWGYLKHRVFRNNPQTLDQLKNTIEHEITEISRDLLDKTVDSLFDRLMLIISENGAHIEH